MSDVRRIFISYQRTDERFARLVRERLVGAGLTVWMDQYDIPVGAYWPDEIDKALSSCDIVVGILSPDAIESRNVKNEWDWTIQNNRRLLLVQVIPTVLPHRYVSINFIDATGSDSAPALTALLRALDVDSPASEPIPVTHYARSGEISVAYQVIGDGPNDLVLVPGFVSNVEYIWEEPNSARALRRLASFSRLIMFDKRGTGLSDRVAGVPTLEERMDDVRAVMDAVGSERATIMGASEGGPMAALFAATYPERTDAIILYGTYACRSKMADYPWGRSEEEWAWLLNAIEHDWGSVSTIEAWAPSAVNDEQFREWFTSFIRNSASPGAAAAIMRMNMAIDVRAILPSIRAPTLVIHRTGDRVSRVENGRFLAGAIPGARLAELAGIDHMPWRGDTDTLIDTIEAFMGELRGAANAEPDRILATVLHVDVGSPEDLSEDHRVLIAERFEQFRADLVTHDGDSWRATFDGPARAIRCGMSIVEALTSRNVVARAGLHTGEVELLGDDAEGAPVVIASALATTAAAGEVLVSGIVRDLAAGSGMAFAERGTWSVPGQTDEWRVYAVEPMSASGAAT